MIRYDGYDITFQEVPDEVSLVFNITNCPGLCDGCHSPWLRGDYGRPLLEDINRIILKYKEMITCVCFMGEGRDRDELKRAVDIVHSYKLKSCIYSGSDENHWEQYHTDYFKFGSYKPDKGGLSSPDTNQRLYHYTRSTGEYEDITFKFYRRPL